MSSQILLGTKITDLSANVLDLVSLFLTGGSIVGLWCSGNRRLQQLMANGGIRTISFVDEGAATTSRYPQFLSSLRQLSSLSFYRPNDMLDKIDIVRNRLQLLPPTLERLSLRFFKSESVLLASNDDSTSSNAHKATTSSTVNPKTVPRTWSLSKYFPKLRFLELNSFWVDSALEDSDIADLPASLTELRLLSPINCLSSASFRHLSPNLAHFSFRARSDKEWPPEAFSLLPVNLESFNFDGKMAYNAFTILPSTLTRLALPRHGFSDDEIKIAPRSLTSVYWLLRSDLPSNLKLSHPVKELFLHSVANIDINRIDFLPAGIFAFDCGIALNLKSTDCRWPEELKDLRLHSFSWDLDDLPSPPSQDESDASTDCHSFAKLLRTLPMGLRRLEIQIDPQNLTREFPKFNFSFMTQLKLDGAFKLSQSLFENVPRTLDDLNLYPLPAGDDTEKMTKNSWFDFLPSTLSAFRITALKSYGVSLSFFSHLPSGLKILLADIEGNANLQHFQAIPRSLTSLNLVRLRKMELNATKALPENLKRLIMPNLKEGLDLTNLPQKLIRLHAPMLSSKLKRSNIATLPRSMLSLFLHDTKYNGEIAKCQTWPVSLCSLILKEMDDPNFIDQRRQEYQRGQFETPDPRVIERLSTTEPSEKKKNKKKILTREIRHQN